MSLAMLVSDFMPNSMCPMKFTCLRLAKCILARTEISLA